MFVLGGTVGLLALNALFTLMKEYNLYVLSGFSTLVVPSSCLCNPFQATTRPSILGYTAFLIEMCCTSSTALAFSDLRNYSSARRKWEVVASHRSELI